MNLHPLLLRRLVDCVRQSQYENKDRHHKQRLKRLDQNRGPAYRHIERRGRQQLHDHKSYHHKRESPYHPVGYDIIIPLGRSLACEIMHGPGYRKGEQPVDRTGNDKHSKPESYRHRQTDHRVGHAERLKPGSENYIIFGKHWGCIKLYIHAGDNGDIAFSGKISNYLSHAQITDQSAARRQRGTLRDFYLLLREDFITFVISGVSGFKSNDSLSICPHTSILNRAKPI